MDLAPKGYEAHCCLQMCIRDRRRLVSTGLAVALPDGYAGFVQPRSGLAIKQGLSIVNTPGLIDAHYRGELKVILINLDPKNNICLLYTSRCV